MAACPEDQIRGYWRFSLRITNFRPGQAASNSSCIIVINNKRFERQNLQEYAMMIYNIIHCLTILQWLIRLLYFENHLNHSRYEHEASAWVQSNAHVEASCPY